jgi:hypothetical protein
MTKSLTFRSGENIVLRETWAGKIWSARPMIVVQDNAELIALHIPKDIRWMKHMPVQVKNVIPDQRISKQWALGDGHLGNFYSYLKLVIPGESYSVILLRNSADDSLRNWYINLEDPANPIHRTAIGFDSTDMLLDVIVEPNLTDWHWEDEDELQEVVEAGLISPETAKSLYAKGEEVRDMIMSGKSIFNGWEKWRPDPAWKVPVLPEGWDVL